MIDSPNIARNLSEEVLDEMGMEVVENFEKDKKSRKEWERRSEEAMKLALQVVEEKSFPWEKASNVKYPLLTLASIQFASRVDLFNGNDIVKMRINGYDPEGTKTDRAIRISKHMTYQLREEIPNWEEDNDKLFHALPITGTMFKKTYYNPTLKVNCSELVWPKELVFDYWAKNVDDCIRKTHILYMTPNKIEEKVRAKLYLKIDLVNDSLSEENKVSELNEGRSSYEDDNSPRIILEQHCWWDLDGDGYQEPYIFTVDKSSGKVLRIVANYDEEHITYGNKNEIISIEPLQYFTQYSFIPNPDGGNLGLGFGHLLAPVNESVNTLINQLIDAGTLSNMQGGFIGKGLRMKAGKLQFQPGEWKFVQSSGEDLSRNIFPLPTKDPSPVLFNLLSLLVNAGERVGSVTDAITGENPPTNQPATTTLATIEQGLKVFKRIHVRLYNSYTKEFKKIYDLNRKYLDKLNYFSILDFDPRTIKQPMLPATQNFAVQNQQMLVTIDDYRAEKNDVSPTADPNVITEMEKIKKLETLMQTQQLFNWPIEEVKRRFVETMNFPNPDALLQPVQTPPPPEVMKMQMENQIEQAKLQLEQMKAQAESELKGAELDFRKEELALNNRKLEIEIKKTEMDIVKIEADIRKVLAEIETMGADEEELALEVEKLNLEKEKLKAEVTLKQQEMQLKNKEIDTNAQVTKEVNDSKNKKDVVLGMSKMMQDMQSKMVENDGPKKISRDKNGFITSIGKHKVIRDDKGKAIGTEPMEMDEDEAHEEISKNNDSGNISGAKKREQIKKREPDSKRTKRKKE